MCCSLLGEGDPWAGRKDFLEEVLCQSYESRVSQMAAVNAIPLYPTETILWDDNQVPDVHYTGELHSFCFPALNIIMATSFKNTIVKKLFEQIQGRAV